MNPSSHLLHLHNTLLLPILSNAIIAFRPRRALLLAATPKFAQVLGDGGGVAVLAVLEDDVVVGAAGLRGRVVLAAAGVEALAG